MTIRYSGVSFDHLGHASLRIVTDGGTVYYIDPWSEVIASEPRDGDVVFVTHDDRDHYDPKAIEAVATPEATIAAYEAIDTGGLDFDGDVVTLPIDGEHTIQKLHVRTIPAYNDPDGPHVDDDGKPFHADGEVIGL